MLPAAAQLCSTRLTASDCTSEEDDPARDTPPSLKQGNSNTMPQHMLHVPSLSPSPATSITKATPANEQCPPGTPDSPAVSCQNLRCSYCDEDAEDDAALCDICQQATHYKCDQLSSAQIYALEHGSQHHTCNSCKVLVEPGLHGNGTSTPVDTSLPVLKSLAAHPLPQRNQGSSVPPCTHEAEKKKGVRPKTGGSKPRSPAKKFTNQIPAAPPVRLAPDPHHMNRGADSTDWRLRPQQADPNPWDLIEEKDRQLKSRDRIVKAKETSIRKLEDKARELDAQLRESQVLVSKLESTISTLTDENRLLKIKACASSQQPQPAAQNASQPQNHHTAFMYPPPSAGYQPPQGYGLYPPAPTPYPTMLTIHCHRHRHRPQPPMLM